MAPRHLSAMATGPHDQQLIPGARYRRIKRDVTRAITIDGHTELVTRKEEIHIPLPPHDWRRTIRAGVATVAGIVLAASLAWTTASIGGLLRTAAVTAPVAFGAALVFDATWIACIGAEWIARYDDDRAKLPRAAGWASLAVSMAAVFAHGYNTGSVANGAVGASVSALAKLLVTVVIHVTTPPLTDDQLGWLRARQGRIGAQRALAAEEHSLNRDTARLAAERAILGLPGHPTNAPGQSPDTPEQPDRAAGTVRAAVRAAADTLPEADPADIVDHLARVRIDVDEPTVREILGQARATEPDTSGQVLHLDVQDAASIAEIVRRCLADNLTDEATVTSIARRALGPRVKDDSVRRELNRALKKLAAGQ